METLTRSPQKTDHPPPVRLVKTDPQSAVRINEQHRGLPRPEGCHILLTLLSGEDGRPEKNEWKDEGQDMHIFWSLREVDERKRTSDILDNTNSCRQVRLSSCLMWTSYPTARRSSVDVMYCGVAQEQ
jgi:hypothetical protein